MAAYRMFTCSSDIKSANGANYAVYRIYFAQYNIFCHYFAPGGVQNIVMGMHVCLSAQITRKPYGSTSGIFVHVARGRWSIPADDVAIYHVLPVLWMTSCLHIMTVQRVIFILPWRHTSTGINNRDSNKISLNDKDRKY